MLLLQGEHLELGGEHAAAEHLLVGLGLERVEREDDAGLALGQRVATTLRKQWEHRLEVDRSSRSAMRGVYFGARFFSSSSSSLRALESAHGGLEVGSRPMEEEGP